MPTPPPSSFGSLHPAFRVTTGGISREYLLHAPAGHDDSSPLPLVVMLHGGGGTAKTAATATRLSEKADQAGFFAVYPQALPRDTVRPVTFLRNPTFWNVGSGFGHAERLRIDDVAYVRAVLDDVADRNPIDRRRIYVAGFSNGAALALSVAVDLSERIAAVTAVAGHLWRKDVAPKRPVPLLYMIGAQDPIVPPAGGVVHSPWGKDHTLPPVRDTIEQWARWLGCSVEPHIVPAPQQRDGPGSGGGEVLFHTLDEAGHVWPGGVPVLAERIAGPSSNALDATGEMWRFFERYSLDAPR
jgi:polyhydroxybutyrate depolymerase